MEDDFQQFVAGQYGSLVQTAYLLTGDRGHAEDLVQEALYRTYLHWRKVSSYERPEFYVRKVMFRERGHWLRRRRVPESLVEAPADGRAGPDPHAMSGDRDELWRALRRLPPRARAVVVLRYWEDRSEPEVAALLDITVGTVKSQAARGLAALRGLLPAQYIQNGGDR